MQAAKSASGVSILFGLTLFLSAGLLFLVQPMFGKMVLPHFGGAPAVWNTCQVFFQAALLVGYLYAHFVGTRLGLRWQVGLHAVMLLLPLISLPIAVATGWDPPGDVNPIGWLVGLLAVSVGLPFVVVSATAPLLQSWFSRSGDPAAGDPYFLYAASNAGSLLALLAYPLLLETLLPLGTHSRLWTAGYLLLTGLIAACGLIVWRRRMANPVKLKAAADARPRVDVVQTQHTAALRLHWLALAFVPSSLMLSVTLNLTTDVAAVPLLWVAPLAIYLVTFILAFARRQVLPAAIAARVMPLAVLALVLAMVSEATHPAWLLMVVHLTAFFLVALVCHGELARLRPPAEQLTEFYLWLSVGGILGGSFSALVAPLVFRTVLEYPLVLVLACLLRPAPPSGLQKTDPRQELQRRRKKYASSAMDDDPKAEQPSVPGWNLPPWQLDALLPLGLGLVVATLVWIGRTANLMHYEIVAIGWGLPAVGAYLFLYRPVRFALAVAALLGASPLLPSTHGRVLHVERSFFGVHRVAVDPSGKYMQLIHGSTVHGKQRLATDSPDGPTPGSPEPLNYYHRRGPLGDIFELRQMSQEQLPIAAVGLGTGSLAAYAQPGQPLDFYEIDAVVQRLAEDARYFTFLRECRGEYRIILGDARLKVGAARRGSYGLIVVDAFSSDAIPIHLITREALELYIQKLTDRGVVAFHVSNRYLDLSPVLARLAKELNLECLVRADLAITLEDQAAGYDHSIWVVLARDVSDLAELSDRNTWQPGTPAPGLPWTDERANLFSAWRRE